MSVHWIDATIFILYLLCMLAVGFYFLNKNKSDEDYYVGGRNLAAGHVGLSVVATDVGGGFSIGLGGLGFTMGLSGSWMLFTGLLGAWLSAVILIPKIYPLARKHNFLSFPQALSFYYNKKVALLAGIISLIGYLGFTSSQVLAGAKLASATFPDFSVNEAVLFMGAIAVGYTVVGGIKAVIYTDTVQWIILMAGLIFIGLPVGYYHLGGWENIQRYVPEDFFSLSHLSFSAFFNWLITIVPIWFVGMTLYQRIYACRDEATAKKAWKIAGLFEWPVMAFMGVLLGIFARIAFEQGLFTGMVSAEMDPELGLPLFLRHLMPVGFMGLMMAAYFSAVMSTADSCLMAASGNFLTDILGNIGKSNAVNNRIGLSQLITLAIGILAILLATTMQNVLSLMLYSYSFMVSGLFVPVMGMLFVKNPSPLAAFCSMIAGGVTTLVLILAKTTLPFGLDANFFGITVSALVFICIHYFTKKKSNGFYHSSPR